MRSGIKILASALLLVFVFSGFATSQTKEEKKVIIKKKSGGVWIGVSVKDLNSDLAEKYGVKSKEGVIVTEVEEDSPAEKAGIKKNDLVLKFGKDEVKDSEQLVELVQKYKAGDNVVVQVSRDNEKKNISVVIANRPKENMFNVFEGFPKGFPFNMGGNRAKMGVQLIELNPELGEYFGSPTKKGMLVKKVEKDSPAEKAGVKAGDVIIGIGKESVEDLHDITTALKGFKKGDKAEVTVIRKGAEMKIQVEVDVKDTEEKEHSNMIFFHGDNGNSFEFDMQGLKEGLKIIGPRIKTMMKNFKWDDMDKENKKIKIEIEKMKPELEKMTKEIKIKIDDLNFDELKIEMEKLETELEKMREELKRNMKHNVIIMRTI